MNVSPKIHSLRVSMYDKSGMPRVNQLTRDFATTSNGAKASGKVLRTKELGSKDHDDFESELERAMEHVDRIA